MSEAKATVITDEELKKIESSLGDKIKNSLEDNSLKKDIIKELRLEPDAVITPENLNDYSDKFYESENKEEQKLAVACYKLAADKGNVDAMYNCGLMLKYGDRIVENKAEAAKYYKMAADKGNVDAMNSYAAMLEDGDGIEVNKAEAAKYYKMAADKGNVYAMNSYAVMLNNGDGIDEDKKEAARYYKMAIEKGNANAMFNYALMLNNGNGIDKDKKEAAKYYKLAADKGNVDAMYNYALMLDNGNGIDKDKKEAAKYYKMAADKEDVDAMFNYGWMLKNGDGIEVNKAEAAKYYKMAADKRNVKGMFNYAAMLKDGDGIVENKAEAANYFKMAADKEDVDAMFNYAVMLKDGYDGVRPNLVGAAEYFTMAADKYAEEEKKVDKKKAIEYLINILNDENFEAKDKELEKYYNFVLKEENKGLFNGNNEYKDKINQIQQKSEELKGKIEKPDNTDTTTTAEGDGEGGEVESTPEPKKDNEEDLIELKEPGFTDEEINKIKEAARKLSISIADDGKISPSDLNKIGNKLLLSDENLIAKCYKAAADKGNAEAMNSYTSMLYDGYSDVPANKEEAVNYYKMAIEKENANAMFNYAKRLYKGDGIDENKKEAKEYFKKILEIGSDSLIFECASILSEGGDREEAAEFYKAAADKGEIAFIRGYAEKLYKGDGIDENKKEAKEYFEKILEIGKADLIFTYANIFYKDGDREEAAKFYKAAADKRNSSGMFRYAEMLYEGDGITENKEEAEKYFGRILEKYREIDPITRSTTIKGDVIVNFAGELYKNKNNKWAVEYYSALLENNYITDEVPNKLIEILCDKRAIKDLDKDKLKEYYKILDGMRSELSSVDGFDEKMKEIKGNIDNFDRLMAGADSVEKPESTDVTEVNGSGKEKKDEETKKSDSESKSDSEEDLIYLDEDKFTDNEIRKIKKLKTDANISDDDRKISLSKLYEYANHIYENSLTITNEMAKYYKILAENGNIEAMYRYGQILDNGPNDIKDTQKAVQYYKKAADLGNANAMDRYAWKLKNGIGVEEDKKEAIKYYRMAVKKYEDSNYEKKGALVCLVNMLNEKDSKIKEEELQEYYIFVLEENEKEYAKSLGDDFKGGIDKIQQKLNNLKEEKSTNVKSTTATETIEKTKDEEKENKDEEEETELTSEPKKEDNKEDYIELKESEFNNKEIEKIKETANKLKIEIVDNKKINLDDLNKIGNNLLFNNKEDKELEGKCYKAAADKGNAEGMYNYGWMLKNGKGGLKKNEEEAVEYFKKAAEKGNANAMFEYAKILHNGKGGLEKNEKEAVEYFKKAAEKWNVNAMFEYAKILYKGDGINKDEEGAKAYFNQILKNFKDEPFLIFDFAESLYKDGNKEWAVEFYRTAADNGHTGAMFMYAKMLYKGDEIPENKREAAKYYEDIINSKEDYIKDEAKLHYAHMLQYDYEALGMKEDEAKQKAAKYYKGMMSSEDCSTKDEAKLHYAHMLRYDYKALGMEENKAKQEAAEYYKGMMSSEDCSIKDEAKLHYAHMLRYDYKALGMNENKAKKKAAKYYKGMMSSEDCSTKDEAKLHYAHMLRYDYKALGMEKNEAKQKAAEYYKGMMSSEDCSTKDEAKLHYAHMLRYDYKALGMEENKAKQELVSFYKENENTIINVYDTIVDKKDEAENNKKLLLEYYEIVLEVCNEEDKGLFLYNLVCILNKEGFNLEDKKTLKEYYKFVLDNKGLLDNAYLNDIDHLNGIDQIQQKLNKLEEEIKEKAKENEEFNKKRKKKHEEPRSPKQTIATISQGKEEQKEEKKTLENIRDKINERIRTEVKENDDGEIRTKEEIDKEKAEALADKYKSRVRAYETEKKDLKEVKKDLKTQQKDIVNSPFANEYLETFKKSNENKIVSDATFSTIVNSAIEGKEDLTENEEIKEIRLLAVGNYKRKGFGGGATYYHPDSTDIHIEFYNDGFLVGCLDENTKKLFDEPLTINMNGVSEEDKIKLNNTLLLFKTNPAIAFASLSKIEGIKMTMGDKDINIGNGVGKQLMEAYSIAAKTRKQVDELEYLKNSKNSKEIKNLEGDKKEMIDMLINTTIKGLSSNKGTRESILKDNEAVNNINDVAKIVKGIVENIGDTKKNSLMSKIMDQYGKYKNSMKENEIALFKVVVNTALLHQYEKANERLEEIIKNNGEVVEVNV